MTTSPGTATDKRDKPSTHYGIDLGTTFSALSFYDVYNNRVDTIDLDSADGTPILHSVVHFPEGGREPVVGETAVNARIQYPERTIVGIKRSMGTSYTTPEIDGRKYTPQEISAIILKVLAGDGAAYTGEDVRDVVITVPAYFGDNERAATEEAGQLAGFNVLALLPEPQAAVLAFAVDKAFDMDDRHVLVYDLGGGTFDVTLVHVHLEPVPDGPAKLRVDTLCKDGNASLGGLDWDRNLAEIVGEKMMQEHGFDVWNDARDEAMLLENCEKAKRHLSRAASVQVTVGSRAVEVTRAEFEDRTGSLLSQTEMLLDQVLEEARDRHGLSPDKVDILLAGGSTRMPMVRDMVTGKMNKEPITHRNPDLLVTIGAAYWAHMLSEGGYVKVPDKRDDGSKVLTPVVLKSSQDISTVGVGIELLRPDGKGGMESYNQVILKKGAVYGAEPVIKEFATAEDNQDAIRIALYDGESEKLEECTLLVECTITGLPPNLPAGERIRIELGYDNNGIIRGRATVVTTGQSIDIEYDRSHR